MKCPSCDSVDLLMSERQGIEIDYCPKCRGVWLDRGELDKFIQQSESQNQGQSFEGSRSNASSSPESYNENRIPRQEYRQSEERDSHGRPYEDDDYERNSYRGKKKESFFSRLFDFD